MFEIVFGQQMLRILRRHMFLNFLVCGLSSGLDLQARVCKDGSFMCSLTRNSCLCLRIPPELVRGTFIMLHKKGSRDDMANYRATCLLCHSYKLLSAVVARRLMAVLEDRLPDTQAGFRPARGCRDNVCALRWFISCRHLHRLQCCV